MYWMKVVCFGLYVSIVTADFCLYDTFEASQGLANSSCALVQTGQTLSQQCRGGDLVTLVYPLQFDKKTFWIKKDNLCTSTTCEALVLNSTDIFAPTSLYCLPCGEQHNFLCDENGLTCITPASAVSASSTVCTESWMMYEGLMYQISNVRRTLAAANEWCKGKNGTAVEHEINLKFVDNVPIQNPDVAYYWIAVPVKDRNGGALGTVLSTLTTKGSRFTPKFNIFDVTHAEQGNLYGCICIKRDETYSTTTTTSTTSMKTTTTKSTTTTRTTTPTPPTTTMSTSTTTQRSVHPGDVLTGMYKNIITNNGLMKKPGVVTQFTVRRSAECAMKCNRTSGCRAYFYDKSTSTCQLLDGNNPTTNCDNVSTAKYYEQQ